MNPFLPCRLCQSPTSQIPYLTLDSYTLIRCDRCQTASTNPLCSEKELKNIYVHTYRSRETGQRFPRMIDTLMKIWHIQRARRMTRLAGADPILDVGCGQAIELSHLQSKGVTVYGLECSPDYAKTLSQNTRVPVFSGNLTDLPLPPESCGLISFLHSLEHFMDPAAELRAVTKLLKPHGFLMISVPDLESREARLFGSAWFHLDLPRHRYHFSRTGLITLLQTKGFRVISVRKFAPEYDFFSLVQSMLNRMYPAHPNLLYHILLKEETKQPQDYQELIREIPGILIALLISVPLTLLGWLGRGSGTVEIVAQKISRE